MGVFGIFFGVWLYFVFPCPSNPPTSWHNQATEHRQLTYFHVIANLLGMIKVSKHELEEHGLRAEQMELCPLMNWVAETGRRAKAVMVMGL